MSKKTLFLRVQRFVAVFLVAAIMLSATMLVTTTVKEAEATPGFTDFNGDGFEDLAIGVPSEDVGSIADAGAVNVIYGSSSGLSATAVADQFWNQGSTEIKGTVDAGDVFGEALAAGDFDNDGMSDLVVGVLLEDFDDVNDDLILNVGAVNVIYGSTSGLAAADNQLFQQDTPSVEDVAEAGDSFGRALASG